MRVVWPGALAAAAAVAGILVARRYAALGLTLVHYDAKAHLVVARRLFDSLTPGYQQIGAVWLPLPHLLNAIFVQYDPWFRSGASAVAISIAAFALAVFAASALILRATGSRSAALVGALAIALNPNLLYLQSTPMTEPLLLGVTLAAVLATYVWVEREVARREADVSHDANGEADTSRYTEVVGIALALACLTRYEAWPIVAATSAAAWFALCRGRHTIRGASMRVLAIARYPLAVIVGFLIHSRITVGEWFANDFYTPDNPARHDAALTSDQVAWGIGHLTSPLVAWVVGISAAVVFAIAVFSRRRAVWLLLVAPLAAAAVPWVAFYSGHPYRIRYMVTLAALGALPLGAVAGAFAARWRVIVSAAFGVALAFTLHPLDRAAPMVVEAQWDRPNADARRHVVDCLAREFRPGEKIMASMGSLAHLMQETASAGFTLNDYLHEGNGDLWLQAIVAPRPYVEWVLVQEYAEGGDMLAHIAREKPAFLDGFTRVCDGGGVGVYKRIPDPRDDTAIDSTRQ